MIWYITSWRVIYCIQLWLRNNEAKVHVAETVVPRRLLLVVVVVVQNLYGAQIQACLSRRRWCCWVWKWTSRNEHGGKMTVKGWSWERKWHAAVDEWEGERSDPRFRVNEGTAEERRSSTDLWMWNRWITTGYKVTKKITTI